MRAAPLARSTASLLKPYCIDLRVFCYVCRQLALLSPRRAFAPAGDASVGAKAAGLDISVRRGFTTNILNPEVGLFYLTLLPQFVPDADTAHGYAFLLARTQAGIALGWFVLLRTIAGAIRPWLLKPGVVPPSIASRRRHLHPVGPPTGQVTHLMLDRTRPPDELERDYT
jgi:hypothetical protein